MDERIFPIAVALLCALVGWLHNAKRRGDIPALAEGRSPTWAWCVAVAAVVGAQAPVWLRYSRIFGANAVVPGDAFTHEFVAHRIATQGLPHGWIDAFNGGFPVAMHYPFVGWLVAILLERFGASPASAIQIVGLWPILLAPTLVLYAGARGGLTPIASTAGAFVVSWLSPWSVFFGGWEGYLRGGLVSQSVAIPIVIVAFTSLAFGEGVLAPAVCGALLMLAHPQVGIAALSILGIGTLVARNREVAKRFAWMLVWGGIFAVVEYGRGMQLRAPFGWPPVMDDWKRVGYPATKLATWIYDGVAFDRDRLPILTYATFVALCGLLFFLRRKSSRVALAMASGAIVFAVSGTLANELARAGVPGASLVQPLRVLPTFILVMAGIVALGVQEVLAWTRRLPRWSVVAPVAALGATAAFIGIQSRAVFLDEYLTVASDVTCRAELAGARSHGIDTWLREPGLGRVDFAAVGAPCVWRMGDAFRSARPFALSFGVGAHVGMNAVAFSKLALRSAGSAARSEALGVRRVFSKAGEGPRPEDGWQVTPRGPHFETAERLGGTDTVGVGCVQRQWKGDASALSTHVFELLERDPDRLFDSRHLIALEDGRKGTFEDTAIADGCDTDGVDIEERGREMGAYEARVRAPQPADVVIRATYTPEWNVFVDGAASPVRRIAPGFFAVRVPAGDHLVVATVALPTGYRGGWVIAGLGLGVAVAIERRRRRT